MAVYYADGTTEPLLGDIAKGKPQAEMFDVIGIVVYVNPNANAGNLRVEYGLRVKPPSCISCKVSPADSADFSLVCR